MRTYEASLWPNNQPPILLGYYKAKNKAMLKMAICAVNGIFKKDDNLTIVLDGPNTPIKRWNKC